MILHNNKVIVRLDINKFVELVDELGAQELISIFSDFAESCDIGTEDMVEIAGDDFIDFVDSCTVLLDDDFMEHMEEMLDELYEGMDGYTGWVNEEVNIEDTVERLYKYFSE